MTKSIAFLRAINVGGHTVKMDALRQLFVELGFSAVETFIASGNVIFDSESNDQKGLESHIAAHLRQALGYPVETFLRTAPELARIAAYQPFPAEQLNAENTTLYIGFTAAPPTEAAQQKLMTYRTPSDEFHIDGCEIYWLCRTRMSDSVFSGALLEKVLGQPVTLRNQNTVLKLVAKYAG